jgi:hypothetical protein
VFIVFLLLRFEVPSRERLQQGRREIMYRAITIVLVLFVVLFVAPVRASQPRHQSAWSVTKSLAKQANGGVALALKPGESVINALHYPQKKQIHINVLIGPCPGNLGQDELLYLPESSKKRICGDASAWHVWSITKSPKGIIDSRVRLKKMLYRAQEATLKSAGCTKRITRGRHRGMFRVVYSGCPRMPLAREFYFTANEAVLKWNCVGRPADSYKKVVLHDPYPEPGAPQRKRWSTIQNCRGSVLPQKLRPVPASKIPAVSPVPPVSVSPPPLAQPPVQPNPPQEPPPGDTIPPSPPDNITASYGTQEEPYVRLSWGEAKDNVGVDRYDVYRTDTPTDDTSAFTIRIGVVPYVPGKSPELFDRNTMWHATYSYFVVAVDTSGNQSPSSGTVTITLGG